MKTPQEIARDTFSAGMMQDTSIHDLMVRAIEADRAQLTENTVTIELDEEHEPCETVAEVLGLIEQGFTSGHCPKWELSDSFDREAS